MPEYRLSDTEGIQIKFGGGGDLLVVAFKEHASGGIVKAGTFFYGSGKAGFGDLTTKLQDRLFYALAPLARGEKPEQNSNDPIKDFAVAFDTVRQGDRIKIMSDINGTISFQVMGQDMGFKETVSLSLPADLSLDTPARIIYDSLNSFLKLQSQDPV